MSERRNAEGQIVVIVGTTRDDRKRVFVWGASPARWNELASVVDENLKKPERWQTRDDLVRIQGSLLEDGDG